MASYNSHNTDTHKVKNTNRRTCLVHLEALQNVHECEKEGKQNDQISITVQLNKFYLTNVRTTTAV